MWSILKHKIYIHIQQHIKLEKYGGYIMSADEVTYFTKSFLL